MKTLSTSLLHALLSLGAIAVLGAPAAAQDFFICSQSDNILDRAKDINGNGSANDPGEYTKCAYDLTRLRTGRDIKVSGIFTTSPTLLWLDDNTSLKAIHKLEDVNGNGVFEPSELTTIVQNLHTNIGQTAGNTFLGGLCEGTTSDLYFTDNVFTTTASVEAGNGIYRVTNLGGPVNVAAALKHSDVVSAYEDSSTATAITISAGAWERIVCHTTSATFYTYNTKDDIVYAMKDIDSDGKFTTAGEVVNFVNLSGNKSGLNRNVDFATGPLFTQGIDFASVAANSSGNRLSLLYVEVDQSNGVVWLGTRTSTQTGGNDISGRVLRCQDLNANGTCNDAGEVTVWVDQFSSPAGTFDIGGLQYKPSQSTTPGWAGLAVDSSTGIVYALNNNGPKDAFGVFTIDTVWKLDDLNLDGDANDVGEQIAVVLQNPAGSFSNELEVVPAGTFSATFASCMNYETAGAQSSIPNLCNTAPTLSVKTQTRFYKGAPYLGNSDYQISVTGTRIGSTFAQLWISQADWDPVLVKNFWDLINMPPFSVGVPYPVDLSSRNIDEWLPLGYWNIGSPMYLDLLDLSLTGTFYLQNGQNAEIGSTTSGVFTPGAPAAGDTLGGKCTIGALTSQPYLGRFDANVAVPNNAFLIGQVFRCQWFTSDPQTATPPIPYAVSDVGIIRIE